MYVNTTVKRTGDCFVLTHAILLRLNAETLELRRLKSDLSLMYRTVYGHCGLCVLIYTVG